MSQYVETTVSNTNLDIQHTVHGELKIESGGQAKMSGVCTEKVTIENGGNLQILSTGVCEKQVIVNAGVLKQDAGGQIKQDLIVRGQAEVSGLCQANVNVEGGTFNLTPTGVVTGDILVPAGVANIMGTCNGSVIAPGGAVSVTGAVAGHIIIAGQVIK